MSEAPDRRNAIRRFFFSALLAVPAAAFAAEADDAALKADRARSELLARIADWLPGDKADFRMDRYDGGLPEGFCVREHRGDILQNQLPPEAVRFLVESLRARKTEDAAAYVLAKACGGDARTDSSLAHKVVEAASTPHGFWTSVLLAGLGEKKDLEALKGFAAKSESAEVRGSALRELFALLKGAARPQLEKALGDPAPGVRAEAKAYLALLAP